jgi:hypothetical protein
VGNTGLRVSHYATGAIVGVRETDDRGSCDGD